MTILHAIILFIGVIIMTPFIFNIGRSIGFRLLSRFLTYDIPVVIVQEDGSEIKGVLKSSDVSSFIRKYIESKEADKK